MRIVFIGGTKRGYLTLRSLLDSGANVVGIVSLKQDAHETERYEQPIRQLAEGSNLPIFETKLMKDRDYGQLLKGELNADLAIAVGVRVLISEDVYNAPKFGTVAFHDSFLPEYRGFAPLNWSIINGEKTTGVTAFLLNEKMDGGDIVDQVAIEIGEHETGPALYEKVCDATVELVARISRRFESGNFKGTPQNYAQGSFTCSRIPADGLIDWGQSTASIYNLVRALTHPYPGAFTFYKNSRLFVWKAEPLADAPTFAGRIPGRVVGFSKDEGWVDVLTGDGILRLQQVQIDGAMAVNAADVITSVKLSLGLDVLQLWERLQELEIAERESKPETKSKPERESKPVATN